MKKNIKKVPVFFIASQAKQKRVVINFYTIEGKPVDSKAVKKEHTNAGTQFFTVL